MYHMFTGRKSERETKRESARTDRRKVSLKRGQRDTEKAVTERVERERFQWPIVSGFYYCKGEGGKSPFRQTQSRLIRVA